MRESVEVTHEEIDLHIKVPGNGKILITAVTSDDGNTRIHQIRFPLWLDQLLNRIKAWVTSTSKEVSTVTARTTWILIAIGLILFLGTRLIGVDDFPPGFYSDEVTNAVRAAHLIRDGFHDYEGHFLPTFFLNDNKYSLGTTVYLQIIPYLLFGHDIFIVRSVSVLLATLASYWMARTLIRSFKLTYGWVALFLLISSPAWFFYSRMAFETLSAASFYMGFLHFYLRYRLEDRKYIYPSMICAALSFYSYFPAQVVVPLTYLAFLILDRRYHVQDWKKLIASHLFLLILMIPLIRFVINHPENYGRILQEYNSIIAVESSLIKRLFLFLANYLKGINPLFWFNPTPSAFGWFEMKPYGYLSLVLFPFFLIGLYLILRDRQKPERRVLLAAWLIAPLGSALIAIVITRMLIAIIPVAMITSLGLAQCFEWLQQLRIKRIILQSATATGFIAATVIMLLNVMNNSQTWIKDYGVGGIQWGAKQVFTKSLELHEKYPQKRVRISGGWAWQADTLKMFFVPDEYPIETGNADTFLDQYLPELSDFIFILIPEDFAKVVNSPIIGNYQVDEIIPLPNGEPGFYVTHFSYSPDVEQILESIRLEETRLVEEKIQLLGQDATIRHTRILEGEIRNIFDNDHETFLNTSKVNPLVVEVEFSKPILMKGVSAVVGSENVHLTIELTTTEGEFTFKEEFPGSDGIKTINLLFDAEHQVTSFRYIQQDPYAVPEAIVHLWELTPIK